MELSETSVSPNLIEIGRENRPKRKRNAYSLQLKRSALKQLITNEINHIKEAIKFTALELGIKYQCLQRWSKKRNQILNSAFNENTRKMVKGPALKYPDVEAHTKLWIITMRELSLCVTCDMVVCEIFISFPGRFDDFTKCKKWVYNAMKRMKISSRAKTHEQSNLDEEEMGEIHLDFLQNFERLKSFLDIPPNLIVNMDETGCYFNMTANRTFNLAGQKNIRIKASKISSHCSVFLAVALNGSKLKPLVVFKGVPGATTHRGLINCDQRNSYTVQVNAFCDSAVMHYWIEQCLIPFNPEGKTAMLMMDNFAAHNVASVREKIADEGWVQLCLPPNMTSRVQILDVGINKPFKDRMKAYFNQFMVENVATNQKVTRELMGKWIADSWANIPDRFVMNTCRSIGFIPRL